MLLIVAFILFLLTLFVYLFLSLYSKYAVLSILWLVKFLGGFESKTVKPSNSNQTFSYMERGHRSKDHNTVVFIHGFTATKESFADVSKYLSTKYHIVSLDLPGHGMTSGDTPDDVGIAYFVEEVKKFLDAIGLGDTKIHLIGESMGGHIVGYFAAMYPNSIACVTMVCPHGIYFNELKEPKEVFLRTGKHYLLPEDYAGVKNMMLYLSHKQTFVPEFVFKGMLELRMERNNFYKKVLNNLLLPPNDRLLESSLKQIISPSMLMWGKLDKVLDASCVDVIKKNVPNLKKCVLLENTGHVLTFETPKEVATSLDQLINSL
eukprot:TCONS_00010778-protein